jgi:hypothetical protein
MTDEELSAIFTELAASLRANDLGWIVDQVENHIEEGRLYTKRVRRGRPEERELLGRMTKSTRGTVIGTEPYSNLEQVQILINAVRTAFHDSASLEESVKGFLQREVQAEKVSVVRAETVAAVEAGDVVRESTSEVSSGPIRSSILMTAPDRDGAQPHEAVTGANVTSDAFQRVRPLLDALESLLGSS